MSLEFFKNSCQRKATDIEILQELMVVIYGIKRSSLFDVFSFIFNIVQMNTPQILRYNYEFLINRFKFRKFHNLKTMKISTQTCLGGLLK